MESGAIRPEQDLRTLDNALSPEAASTNRKSITRAVLFIFLQIRAAAADMAGRIIKQENFLSKIVVFLRRPDDRE